MTEKLFGRGRRGGVLLIAGAVLGAAVAGPGASVALKKMGLTTTTADKRYIKRGETTTANQTVETKIDRFTSSTFTPIATAKIKVPSQGWIYAVGSVSAKDDSSTAGDGKLQYRLSVGTTPLSTTADSFELFLPALPAPPGIQEGRQNGAVNGVLKVTTPGIVNVNLDAQQVSPGTGATILGRSVSALFVPKGKLPRTTRRPATPPVTP